MKVMSRSAGSLSSTAIFASVNSAPSMISAHLISSASGAASNPNLARHGVGQELRAALRLRIVELAPGRVGAEVILVARKLERRGVVVEPPGQARILRVAEIDAGILVAVEAVGRERVRLPFVLEGPERDLDRPLGDAFPVETGEHARRAATVEAVAVIEDAQAHFAKRRRRFLDRQGESGAETQAARVTDVARSDSRSRPTPDTFPPMPEFLTDLKRTHDCGALRASDAGQRAVLYGWVHARRDHGGCVFIDLRDRGGLTQVVFEPGTNAGAHAMASELRREFCVGIAGVVRERGGHKNPNLDTGDVEIAADTLTIFSTAETPPFNIGDPDAGETVRLKHRYLDLRSPALQKNFLRRSQVYQTTRRHLARERLHRDRDAVHGQVHARRRAQLPRPLAPQPGPVLRPRRVAPDLQAAVHGLGHGPLLPDRPLLPRRGSAPRPAAGVHPDRSRDELRRRGRRAADRRGADGRPVEGRARRRHPPALPPPHPRRGDGEVRLRQARHPVRAAARRPDRDRHPPRRRRGRSAAGRGQGPGRRRQGLAPAGRAGEDAVARRSRQAGGVREGVRGARASRAPGSARGASGRRAR